MGFGHAVHFNAIRNFHDTKKVPARVYPWKLNASSDADGGGRKRTIGLNQRGDDKIGLFHE